MHEQPATVVLTDLPTGKQARQSEEPSRKSSPPQQPKPVPDDKAMPPSEPVLGHQTHAPMHHDAYSEGPGDAQNRVAQAGHAAAHHTEPAQHVSQKSHSKSKRIDEANLAKLVAEENASKSKFPRYPGLERYELVEKMGDGAFSNVYRARDLTGEYQEVGIKVVRKYEMNNMQVSLQRAPLSLHHPCLSFPRRPSLIMRLLLFSNYFANDGGQPPS
jgi:hypothetical protein